MATVSISLTQGKVALIDEEDYPLVSRYSWCAACPGGKWYAYAYDNCDDSASHNIALHRLIMGVPEGIEVDHINGDGLDCTRANMREATILQNRKNRTKQETWRGNPVTSRYKGVCWKANRWEASIACDKTSHYLGRFASEIDAARAYDAAATRLHGAFARLNFPAEVGAAERAAPIAATTVGKVRNAGNTSGYRGVFPHKNLRGPKRWHATIQHEHRAHSLGYHETAEQAARAYDAKARDLLGERAKLNFPD